VALGIQMDMNSVKGAGGGRSDLEQTLSTASWGIRYVDNTQALDGVIVLEITGGPFDHQARYEYLPADQDPQIDISCLE